MKHRTRLCSCSFDHLVFWFFHTFEFPYSVFGAASRAKEIEQEGMISEASFCVRRRLRFIYHCCLPPQIYSWRGDVEYNVLLGLPGNTALRGGWSY